MDDWKRADDRPPAERTLTAEASGSSAVHQAGRDLYLTSAGRHVAEPGRGSAAVPLGRLEHAVRGRADLLSELTVEVDRGGRVVVLHGAGGYGKTTVALALAESLRERLSVWWVDATSPTTLADGLREVSLQAGATPEAVRAAWAGEASAPDLLWQTLDRAGARWLLVMDNADDPRALADTDRQIVDDRGWLRVPGSGATVVITSRDGRPGTWGRRALLRSVHTLGLSDGAALLVDLAPTAGPEPEARRLAERLGGLPLALRLAGTYLEATGHTPALPGLDQPRTFTEYGAALDARFVELVDETSTSSRREREMLSRTWELSLDLLTERGHPHARPLLRCLSLFAAAPIPYDLLDATLLARSPLFTGLTPQLIADTLGALGSLGLVEQNSDGVQLHPLLRETNLHQADAREHLDAYQAVRLSVVDSRASALDPREPRDWPSWRTLLPHCAEAAKVEDLPSAHLALRAAVFGNAVGSYRTAAELNRRAHDRFLRLLGATHPDTLAARHEVAWAARKEGDLRTAVAEYRELVRLRTEVLGAEHSDTLQSRENLALVLRVSGANEQALTELNHVLAARTRTLGPEHRQTLATRHGVAETLRMAGALDEALSEYRAVLDLQERVLGAKDSDTVYSSSDYAITLRHSGHLDAAHAQFRQVIAARTAEFGADHPKTLSSRQDFAFVLRDQGDLSGAEAVFREVADLKSALLGPDHPATLITRNNLAHTWLQQGRVREAETEFHAVLAIRERVLEQDHPSTLITRTRLVEVRLALGLNAEAERACRDLLAVQTRILGSDNPRTLDTRCTLADALDALGDPEAAATEREDVLRIARARFSPNHMVIARASRALAERAHRT